MTLFEIARDAYTVRARRLASVALAVGALLAALAVGVRSLRREIFTVGGLGLMVAGAWTYSLDGRGALGFVVSGAALWTLEWLTTPGDDTDGSA